MVSPYIGEIRLMAVLGADALPPDGWAICDGRALEIKNYEELYSMIGTIYGGDGVRYFRLPNLSGKIAMGLGTAPDLTPRPILGAEIGHESVEVKQNGMPSHSHSFTVMNISNPPTEAYSTNPAGRFYANPAAPYKFYADADRGLVEFDHNAVSSTQPETPHNNMMPSLCIYYMIATDGLYISGNSYKVIPIVTGIEPRSGPAFPNSSNVVKISGTRLTGSGGPATVKFGHQTATILQTPAPTDTEISVLCPPGSGTVAVTVTAGGQTSQEVEGALFTYLPTIKQLLPNHGPLSGSEVRILGRGFEQLVSVQFGTVTIPASQITQPLTGLLQLQAPPMPPGTGIVQVSVTTEDNGVSASVSYDYSPSVTGIYPDYGPPSGSTPVTLIGSNFTNQGPDLEVLFGTNPATDLVVISDTKMTCVSPQGSGIVDVYAHLKTDTGSSNKPRRAVTFDYAPLIKEVSPLVGQPNTPVTIIGRNFVTGAVVYFGTVAATPTNITETQIVVNAPSGVQNQVPITVQQGSVRSAPYKQLFDFAPIINSMVPNAGSPAGNPVTLTGVGFTGTLTVQFGPTALTATANNGSVTVNAPAGTANTSVLVTVTSATGTSAPVTYYYSSSAVGVTNVSPAIGPANGGQTVTITGYGFLSPTVQVGNAAATVTSWTPTTIVCTSPPGTGVAAVTVTSNGTTSQPSPVSQYSYAPVVSSVSPNSGSNKGLYTVTVQGFGFVAGPVTVQFGGTQLSGTAVSSTSITVPILPGGSGLVPVTVQTAGGTGTLQNAFTYTPTILSLKPDRGSPYGGDTVQIKGVGLKSPTSVLFDNTPVQSFSIIDDNTISVVTPAVLNQSTVHAVVVCDAGVTIPWQGDTYTYNPKINSLWPQSALAGTVVDIDGVGFTNTTKVLFGTQAANFTVINDLSIQATVPAPSPGNSQVLVTVQAGNVWSKGDRDSSIFTYAPTITSITPVSGSIFTDIDIMGYGLQTVTTAMFGNTPVPSSLITHISQDHIKIKAPPRNSGPATIVLGAADGATSNTNFIFTYTTGETENE